MLPSNTVAYESPQEIKEEKVLTIEEKIVQEALRVGYSPTRAVAIARAESNLNPNAKNKTSSASGLFQFIDSTYKYYCVDLYSLALSLDRKNDPDVQIECALKMLSTGGESHWNESRHIWGNVW